MRRTASDRAWPRPSHRGTPESNPAGPGAPLPPARAVYASGPVVGGPQSPHVSGVPGAQRRGSNPDRAGACRVVRRQVTGQQRESPLSDVVPRVIRVRRILGAQHRREPQCQG